MSNELDHPFIEAIVKLFAGFVIGVSVAGVVIVIGIAIAHVVMAVMFGGEIGFVIALIILLTGIAAGVVTVVLFFRSLARGEK